MESNEHYYRRRAIQELTAARTALTEVAKRRRTELAETYLRRLAELTGADETALLATALAPHRQQYA